MMRKNGDDKAKRNNRTEAKATKIMNVAIIAIRQEEGYNGEREGKGFVNNNKLGYNDILLLREKIQDRRRK